MNILTQEAKKRQAVVKCAIKNNNKSYASRMYGYSLSSVKRWCTRYDGTWQSLVEKSHRPKSNPNRHTKSEEGKIKRAFIEHFERYGWDGVYDELVKEGYSHSFSGMVYVAKRMGLGKENKKKKAAKKYPQIP